MPLYKTITINSEAKILIWKLEETIEKLSSDIQLSSSCEKRLNYLKSELHRRQFLSVRHLLVAAGYAYDDLYYSGNGKPHLRGDNKYISVSHSFNFTGIIIGDQPVGIDIEKRRDKILRIANKFTPLEEYSTLANDEAVIRKLTIVWGAKEAVYKIMDEPGISFLNHIDVEDFNFEDDHTTVTVSYNNKVSRFSTKFIEFEQFTCVYALSSNLENKD
ncbi:MAG TPA: 4'-phosphopantetheinyl transferase superfamily protein [Flavobacteriaceae bacterium]|nr:4'-phosphopantetheinyl transferase superfamily protein [Flavobacteriaceae bacterium]